MSLMFSMKSATVTGFVFGLVLCLFVWGFCFLLFLFVFFFFCGFCLEQWTVDDIHMASLCFWFVL